jgi:hypothetical protein
MTQLLPPQSSTPAPRKARRVSSRPAISRFTARARPALIYVMVLMIFWAIPLSVVSALKPEAARAMTEAMAAYFAALPEPLYALFAAGYLGYTAARQWGKVQGSDR